MFFSSSGIEGLPGLIIFLPYKIYFIHGLTRVSLAGLQKYNFQNQKTRTEELIL